MKKLYDAGIQTVCRIAPVFPGITDVKAIIEAAHDHCSLVWLEPEPARGL